MRVRAIALVTALLGSAVAPLGCAGSTTELVIRVDNALPTDGEVDTLRVELTVDGIKRDYTRAMSGDGALAFPYSIALIEDLDESTPVRCVVEAKRGDDTRVRVAARTRFVPDRRAELTLTLDARCLDVLCGNAETCKDGACVSDAVDASELVVTGDEPGR